MATVDVSGVDPDDFMQRYMNWQEQVYLRLRQTAKDPDLAEGMIKTSINLGDILEELPYSTREELKSRFNRGVLRIGEHANISTVTPIGTPRAGAPTPGRFNIAGAPEAHPMTFLMNQLTVQHDPDRADPFFVGKNIPKAQYMEATRARANSADDLIAAGQRIMVFDTETMGLSKNLAGVREVSAMEMERVGGKLTPTDFKFETHYNVSRGAFGHMGPGGSMKDFVRNLVGTANYVESPASGDEFIDSLTPLLERMKNTDLIVGQNVQFDIGQVVINAMKTKAYNKDPGVRQLVDDVAAKIDRSEVIDTAAFLRNKLGPMGLEMAPELAALGESSIFGLENVMLQTNIAELMRTDLGDDAFDAMQHTAAFDVRLTSSVLEHLQAGDLKVTQGLGLGNAPAWAIRQRHSTLRAYAPTPVSNIADVAHLDPDLWRRVYEQDLDKVRIVQQGTGKALTPDEIRADGTADEWLEYLSRTDPSEGPLYALRSGVNPLEQQVFKTRQILDSTRTYTDSDPLVDHLGEWRRFSKHDQPFQGFLNRAHTLFKRADPMDPEDFEAFQRRMAKSGMPHAGLSLPERIITHAISGAATVESGAEDSIYRTLGETDRRLAEFGDDLGIGRWATRQRVVATGSGAITMPWEILEAAEQAKVLQDSTLTRGGTQMLSLSAIRSGGGDMNLVFNPTQRDASALSQWFFDTWDADGLDAEIGGKTFRDWGLNQKLVDDLRDTLETRIQKHGIGFAHLGGEGGERAAAAFTSMFQDLRDVDRPPMMVGLGKVQAGVVETGAATLNRFGDAGFLGRYSDEMALASRRAAQLGTSLEDKALRARASLVSATGMPHLGEFVEGTYRAVKKRAPLVGGALLAGVGAYYMNKRRKEQNIFDETMQQMPTEGGGDYASYRRDMGLGPAPAVRRQDPLETGGVVGNLDRNSIGHTRMGPQKDAGLFNGLLAGV